MGLQAHLERESWCCFVCVYVLVSVSLPQCYPSLTVWWFCGRLHWFPQASQSRIRSYNGSSELCPRTCQGSPDPTRSPHGSVHFLVMGCLLDPNLLSDFALQLLQGPGPPPPPTASHRPCRQNCQQLLVFPALTGRSFFWPPLPDMVGCLFHPRH